MECDQRSVTAHLSENSHQSVTFSIIPHFMSDYFHYNLLRATRIFAKVAQKILNSAALLQHENKSIALTTKCVH